MPNYTFKMGRLFIDVHYDAALLWIERCNDSRVLFYENTSGRNIVCVGQHIADGLCPCHEQFGVSYFFG